MYSNQSGPRDWSPPAEPSRAQPPSRYSYNTRVRSPRTRGSGALSFVLGVCAAFTILVQPGFLTPNHGYIFSTIGISAVAFGFVALRNRPNARATSIILPTVGILLGALGTLVAGSNALDYYLHTNNPQTVPLGISSPVSPVQSTQPAPAVVAPTPQDHEAERLSLVRVEGTLAYLLKRDAAERGAYPAVLAATSDNQVITPAGSVVLPAGSRFSYTPAADGGGFSMQLTGVAGADARYDTASGVITSQ
ncbi:MAG: hypothetical protein JWM49_1620 [Microbacteriaceae bacterium]|nr:hypothetical protein [Microbacteriaceae bacterium]